VGSPLSQQPSAPMSSITTSNKLVSGSTVIVWNVLSFVKTAKCTYIVHNHTVC
jgi:hypothetical protein